MFYIFFSWKITNSIEIRQVKRWLQRSSNLRVGFSENYYYNLGFGKNNNNVFVPILINYV